MIKININKSYIPIPFINDEGEEEFQLKFYKTDENLQNIMDFSQKIAEADKEEKSNMAEQKEYVKEMVDAMLEEGAFEQMYELDGSILNVMDYLVQIASAVFEEIAEDNSEETLNKYRKG